MKYLSTSILVLTLLACGVSTKGIETMTPAVSAQPPMPTREAAKIKPTGTNAPSPEYEVYRAGILRVRADAGTWEEEIATLQDGEIVNRTDKAPKGDWWEVTTPEGVTGWCNSYYLKAVE